MPNLDRTGNAVPTKLTTSIDAVVTTLTIDDPSGWPLGGAKPFVATLARGTTGEERVLVASRTGSVLSGITRGYDDTPASSHDLGTDIEHGLSAIELDDHDDHVYNTATDQHSQYLRTDGTRAPTGVSAMVDSAVGPPAIAAGPVDGSDATFARSDHTHGLPAAAAPPTEMVNGDTGSEGVAATLARSDHSHPLRDFGPTLDLFHSTSNGTSNRPARADHKHRGDALISSESLVPFPTTGQQIQEAGVEDYTKIWNGVAWIKTGSWREHDYTPTWTTSSGTPPSVGNGTLLGHWRITSGLLWLNIELDAGTTTTFGDAGPSWRFTLPPTFTYPDFWGHGVAAGVGFWAVRPVIIGGGPYMTVYVVDSSPGGMTVLTQGSPETWTSTASFQFQVLVPVEG